MLSGLQIRLYFKMVNVAMAAAHLQKGLYATDIIIDGPWSIVSHYYYYIYIYIYTYMARLLTWKMNLWHSFLF